MSRLRLKIAISLDGFVAGPHQSLEAPLGVGGMRLHEGLGDDLHGLELVRTVAAPGVVHLELARPS